MDNQPWIKNWKYDLAWIIGPAMVVVVVALLLPNSTVATLENHSISWLFLVLMVDVAHVYSTLFKTYFQPEAIQRWRSWLMGIPPVVWILGMALYSFGPMVFWRCMAYLAVYHFVKQQYGFLRIYGRNEGNSFFKTLDTISIYAATFGAVLYWFFNGKKSFHWFMENDFLYFNQPKIAATIGWICLGIGMIWAVSLWIRYRKTSLFNLPKCLLMLGSGLSWWIGIVWTNSDLVFTALNVIAHGIPYMALIRVGIVNNPVTRVWIRRGGILVFLGVIWAFAYVEEFLWDGFIWREHFDLFPAAEKLEDLSRSGLAMVIVPLLSVPQLTHYVLDGVIWKRRKA